MSTRNGLSGSRQRLRRQRRRGLWIPPEADLEEADPMVNDNELNIGGGKDVPRATTTGSE